MAKKRTPNEAHWDMEKQRQVKEEYARWRAEEGRENDSDTAQLFAVKKIAGGFDYMGFKERDLIILLAGRLPYMYD